MGDRLHRRSASAPVTHDLPAVLTTAKTRAVRISVVMPCYNAAPWVGNPRSYLGFPFPAELVQTPAADGRPLLGSRRDTLFRPALLLNESRYPGVAMRELIRHKARRALSAAALEGDVEDVERARALAGPRSC